MFIVCRQIRAVAAVPPGQQGGGVGRSNEHRWSFAAADHTCRFGPSFLPSHLCPPSLLFHACSVSRPPGGAHVLSHCMPFPDRVSGCTCTRARTLRLFLLFSSALCLGGGELFSLLSATRLIYGPRREYDGFFLFREGSWRLPHAVWRNAALLCGGCVEGSLGAGISHVPVAKYIREETRVAVDSRALLTLELVGL